MLGRILAFLNPESLTSILALARGQYMAAYRQALKSYRKRFSPWAAEVMFDLKKVNTPRPFHYYRVDLASSAVTPINITEVNLELPHHRAEPRTFQRASGLSLKLHPVVWNGIDFLSPHFVPEDSEFVAWCSRWLDPDDKLTKGGHTLSGVIHAVTYPSFTGENWMFGVDFGSAPTSAFDELLAVMEQMGCRSVTVGSFPRNDLAKTNSRA
jgi:hypothetical protein